MVNNSFLTGSKNLFAKFEKRLNLLEDYFILVEGQIENWLDFQKSEEKRGLLSKQDELNKKKNFYLQQEKKEFPEATPAQLEQLAVNKAKLEILKQEIDDFKVLGEIFRGTAKESKREIELEKNFFRQYTIHSIITLLCTLLEKLLSDLIDLLENEFGKHDIETRLGGKQLPLLDILLNTFKSYGVFIELDVKSYLSIKGVCKIRNKFVHSLNDSTDNFLAYAVKLPSKTGENGTEIYQSAVDSIEKIKAFYIELKKSFNGKYTG